MAKMLDVKELAERSGASQFTWRRWIAEGRIATVRLGRLVKVREEDYERFIDDNRTEAREG